MSKNYAQLQSEGLSGASAGFWEQALQINVPEGFLMKFFMGTISILMLALAIRSAMASASTKIAGEGIPRHNDQDCAADGRSAKQLLEEEGFRNVQTGCEGTNDDVGIRVPTFSAEHEQGFEYNQWRSKRYATIEQCHQKLAGRLLSLLTAPVPYEGILLKSECVEGSQDNGHGGKENFHQAFLIRFIPKKQNNCH